MQAGPNSGVQTAQRWAQRVPAGRVPAVILGASVGGLSFVRSLGRRGVPTLMLDSARQYTMLTRFGSASRLPGVNDAPQVWQELFERLGQLLPQRPALFVNSDIPAEFVANHRELLRRLFRFVLPAPEVVERIINKRRQYELAKASGIALPRTRFPESLEEVRACAAEFEYPCILKPYKSHVGVRLLSGFKVAVVYSPEQLVQRFAELTAGSGQFMV